MELIPFDYEPMKNTIPIYKVGIEPIVHKDTTLMVKKAWLVDNTNNKRITELKVDGRSYKTHKEFDEYEKEILSAFIGKGNFSVDFKLEEEVIIEEEIKQEFPKNPFVKCVDCDS